MSFSTRTGCGTPRFFPATRFSPLRLFSAQRFLEPFPRLFCSDGDRPLFTDDERSDPDVFFAELSAFFPSCHGRVAASFSEEVDGVGDQTIPLL